MKLLQWWRGTSAISLWAALLRGITDIRGLNLEDIPPGFSGDVGYRLSLQSMLHSDVTSVQHYSFQYVADLSHTISTQVVVQ
jgi:hypothetical protein